MSIILAKLLAFFSGWGGAPGRGKIVIFLGGRRMAEGPEIKLRELHFEKSH